MKLQLMLLILCIALLFIFGGLLLNYDQALSVLGQSLPDAHGQGTFWWWADKYGEWPTWGVVLLCLALYLYSLITKRWVHYQPYLLFILITAWVSPLILNPALKSIVGRPRPSPLYPIHDARSSASFPSGHTASAFVLFAFFYLVPKTKPALKILTGVCLGGWGLVIGISRVVWGAHYPSDVLGGAFLTLMTEYLLWRLVFDRRFRRHDSANGNLSEHNR